MCWISADATEHGVSRYSLCTLGTNEAEADRTTMTHFASLQMAGLLVSYLNWVAKPGIIDFLDTCSRMSRSQNVGQVRHPESRRQWKRSKQTGTLLCLDHRSPT